MKHNRKAVYILLPFLIGFLIFYIVPFFIGIYYSLIDNVFDKNFVGIQNYIEIFRNEFFILALKNTFEFTIVIVPVLIVVSMLFALILCESSNIYRIYRSILSIPMLVPSASIVMLWSIVFADNSEATLAVKKLFEAGGSSFYEKVPIYLFFLWKYTGYNMILFIAGILNIPPELYEAAKLDNANYFNRLRYITLPLLTPTTVFVFIISLVNSFKIFKEVYLLYGSYPKDELYMLQHYMNNQFFKLNYQNLASAAVVFAFIIIIIILLSLMYEKKKNEGVW